MSKSLGVDHTIPDPLPTYITLTELARRWRVSRQTIFNMRRRGLLEAKKVGRLVRIPSAEVVRIEASPDWLASK